MRQYTFFIVLLLVVGGYYGFTQYQKLTEVQTALANEQEAVATLQDAKVQVVGQYQEYKKAFDDKFLQIVDSLEKVYPRNENYTELARLFDKFFQQANTGDNPVFVSDLKFGLPRNDAAKDFAILPVTMTIAGTQNNFLKFLQYIEKSGVLEDGTRLMDVRSISINFNNPGAATTLTSRPGESSAMINVSVGLNAYFQKQAVAKK